MSESDRAAVRAHEQHIVAAEGPHHVGGVYYANLYDAERQRHWTAERMVREAQRRDACARTDASQPRPRVGTWLTARERARVDAAAAAQLQLVHREELHAIRDDLTTGLVDATLISAALVRLSDVPRLSALVRGFPGNPAVGLVAEADEPQALAGTLAFGRAGVDVIVDARNAAGWPALRRAFDSLHLPDAFVRQALRELVGTDDGTASADYTAGWVRFLAAVFSPRTTNAKRLAAMLGVSCSTLVSRFCRAGLPTPKRYVAFARFVWAARLAETPGLPIAAIADRIEASSPQSLTRTIRRYLGLTGSEFRRRFDGRAMLAHFHSTLVEPYVATLRTFDPLSFGPRDHARGPNPHRPATANGAELGGRAA